MFRNYLIVTPISGHFRFRFYCKYGSKASHVSKCIFEHDTGRYPLYCLSQEYRFLKILVVNLGE